MPSPTPRFRSLATIASCLTLAAALTALPSVPAAAKNPSTAPAAAASTSDAEYERTGASPTEQNAATASASAARQNVRVEVLSERTATSRTWAVPEGGFVAEQYAGDVRFKDSAAFATQGWRDIDPTLIRRSDGTVGPKSMPGTITLTGQGAGRDLITRTDSDGTASTLDLAPGATWPEPTLQGSTATYSQVLPGVDVQVDVAASSIRAVWVLTSEEGVDSLFAGQQGESLAATARLKSKGASFKQVGDKVALVDGQGRTKARFTQGYAWDGTAEVADATEKVDFTTQQRAAARGAGATSEAESDLTVHVDRAWLTASERTFPVTIDPDLTTGLIRDVTVRDGQGGYLDDTELKIGFNGSYRHRSFINFNRDDFNGRQVTWANLQIWNKASYAGCAAHMWEVWESNLFQDWHGGNNQPARRDGIAWTTEAKNAGSPACQQNWITINITDTVRNDWTTGLGEAGIQLRATDEGAIQAYKRFRSSSAVDDYNKPLNTPPRVIWGYNSPPGQATGLTLQGYSPVATLLAGTNPILQAQLPSAPCYRVWNCLRVRFDIYRSRSDGGWDFLYWTDSDRGAGGNVVTAPTPNWVRPELKPGHLYSVHAIAYSTDTFADQNAFWLNPWNNGGWQPGIITFSFVPETRPAPVTANGQVSGASFALPASSTGADGSEYWVAWKPTLASATNGIITKYCWSTTSGVLTSEMNCAGSNQAQWSPVKLLDDGFGGLRRTVYVRACTAAQCGDDAVFHLTSV